MTSKKKWLIMVAVSTTILLLAACGSSGESKIIGSWKTVVDDNITSYLEINEERFINRSESVTAEYTMTETQNDNFRLEVINPESGSIEFMFEGYFEDDDKIIVVETPEGTAENSELIRVDNIAEEMEKEEEKLQEQAEKEAKELEEEENNKSTEDKNKELEAEYGELGTTEHDLEAITEEVTIKSVTDGETVVVEGENGKETLQLLLIDTPEIVDSSEDPQEFGSRARNNLENLLGATVKLERGNPEKDKNGQTLGYIWMKNGPEYVNFNKLLVQKGFARVSNSFEPNTKYLDEFKEAENEAKEEQLKIWSIEGYVTDDGFDLSVYGQ